MYFFLDWTWILLIPGIIVSIWAQSYVSKTYKKYSEVFSRSGATGLEFGTVMLRQNGVTGVSFIECGGTLTDHFDPKKRVVALSSDVSRRSSVSSIAIAAHECGHVLQHEKGYTPIKVRTALVPVVNIVSWLCFPLIFIGILVAYTPFIEFACWAYFAVCIFQIVTLPVEFNASSRAIDNITASGVLKGDELTGAKAVLRAAALTYVAALLVTLLNFFRLLIIARRH